DMIIIQAGKSMTDLDLINLNYVLEKMRLADEITNTIGVGERGRDFHNILYSIANNDIAIQVLDSLQPRFDRYRFLSTTEGKKRTSKAVEEHHRIYMALKDKKIEIARELMLNHLENSKKNVISSLLEKE